MNLDPAGTCHLVMCPDKGKHPPHPSSMSAPDPETYARLQAERVGLTAGSQDTHLPYHVLTDNHHPSDSGNAACGSPDRPVVSVNADRVPLERRCAADGCYERWPITVTTEHFRRTARSDWGKRDAEEARLAAKWAAGAGARPTAEDAARLRHASDAGHIPRRLCGHPAGAGISVTDRCYPCEAGR